MGGGASKTPKQEAPTGYSSVQPTQQPADQTEPDQNQGVSVSIRPPSGYEDEPSGSRRESDTPNSPAEGYRSDGVSGGILDPLQENTKDAANIPVNETGYPPPKPAVNRKSDILRPADIAEGDKRAKQIKPGDANTFEDLAYLLTKGMSRDVQQIRAIFSWVVTQNVQEIEFPANVILDSHMDVLRRIRDGQSSYTTLFTLLCRAAHIPCVIIHGIAKSAGYEVGHKDLKHLRNLWNAVFINGGWRFVFPLWACRTVKEHAPGDWTLVDSKVNDISERIDIDEDSVSTTNDHYFLTDPEEFIHRCFPDKPDWQLLRTPLTKDEFLDMPLLMPPFFDYKLKLLTKPKCVLNSKDGMCNISIKSPQIEDMLMTYELYYDVRESGSSLPSGVPMDRCVAIMQQKGKIAFSVRFLHPGIYRLDIHGSLIGNALSLLGSFKLVCNKTRDNIKPYPCNPDIGFGPNLITNQSGLLSESHHESLISFNCRRGTEIIFTMSKQMQIQTKLFHQTIDGQQLKEYVSHRKIGNQLCILLAIPQKGEYVLQINNRWMEEPEFQNVCNYLLEAGDGEKKPRNYETPSEKKLRCQLHESLRSMDPAFVKRAIDQFCKSGLEDSGETQQARDRLVYLKLSKGLRDSINRRNLEALEESVQQAKSSKFSHKLQPLIQKAEEEVADLKKTDKHAHDILEMNLLTVTELRNYKTPKPIVHDVMKATFILLGERQDLLEDWMDVQNLMWKIGKEALMKRIENFDKDSVDEQLVKVAARCLKPYNEDMAHATSAGCGTFYVWANKIVSEYANDEKNEKQHQTSSHYKSSSKRDYSATDPYSGDEDEGVDNALDQFSLDGDDSTDPRGRSNHSHGGVNNPDEIRHHEADDGYNS